MLEEALPSAHVLLYLRETLLAAGVVGVVPMARALSVCLFGNRAFRMVNVKGGPRVLGRVLRDTAQLNIEQN